MKLIATDMDGTLLNENGKISEENCAAILRAIDHGVHVVIATGRSYEAAMEPLQEVGLVLPIISLNGAMVYNQESELLDNIPMNSNICKEIQAACELENLYFEVYTNKGIVSRSREHFLDVLVDILMTAHPNRTRDEVKAAIEQRFQDEKVTFVNDYHSLFQDPNIDVYKLLAFSMDESSLASVSKKFENNDQVIVTSSGTINLEFNHPEAQKGIAVKKYADSLGIDMKDVVAFGDSYNDLSMLLAAGKGIAMENAVDYIKEQSDAVTKKNIEHGVAVAIEELLKDRTT
ncbi:Cof-type HAD-IIB family hydrolase [Ornithinibacillus halotolerans]|uniref:Haloacid dehalogenase n=1 Tax=Ornithinibacillus halotolerans TaxID=1274357 RepID=A0A916RQU8_9BACI|nr:Cof-type HAD-IIB family hydrolase [Ornithinibacillus halotolerans]GGA65843.1 haloacid dehalogenase [Ornithinibacillus halotolerans]